MTVTRRFLRDQRRSFLWWALALVAATGLTTGLYPSVRDQPGFEQTVEDLPEIFQALAGISEGLSVISAVGYLHARLLSLFTPFILVFFGVTMGTRAIAGSEHDGSLELLLANPVSRRRVAIERALGVVVLLVAMGLIALVATILLSAPVGLLDEVRVRGIADAVLAASCLALLHAAVGFGVGAATGNAAAGRGSASVLAIWGFLVHGIITIATGIAFLRFVAPWHWYADRVILLDGLSPQGTVLPLLVAVVVATMGAVRFERRDLR